MTTQPVSFFTDIQCMDKLSKNNKITVNPGQSDEDKIKSCKEVVNKYKVLCLDADVADACCKSCSGVGELILI